jgi:hypothetical protein
MLPIRNQPLPHPILKNHSFAVDFARLSEVTLNPERHTAANALEHAHRVAARAAELALLNGVSDDEAKTLIELAYVHDIGKAFGTARPAASVELLPRYDITDAQFVELVRYHDVNLPWWQSAQRGEPPTDKAWRKLQSRCDVRLLCLFMVADRADCPGGFANNPALIWFLKEATRRGLVSPPLQLEKDHA